MVNINKWYGPVTRLLSPEEMPLLHSENATMGDTDMLSPNIVFTQEGSSTVDDGDDEQKALVQDGASNSARGYEDAYRTCIPVLALSVYILFSHMFSAP